MLWNYVHAKEDRGTVAYAMEKFLGESAVDAIHVGEELEARGLAWQDPQHDAHMAALESLAARALVSRQITPDSMNEVAARAREEVDRGAWTLEAYETWAASTATFETDLAADVDLARTRMGEAGAVGFEGDRASWHVTSVEVARIEGTGARLPQDDLEGLTDTVFLMNGQAETLPEEVGAAVEDLRASLVEKIWSIQSRSAILELREDLAAASNYAM